MGGPRRLGGASTSRSAYDANSTRVDLNSYPLPDQSILHRENVSGSPLNVGALTLFVIFISAVCIVLAVFFAALRAIGL